MDASQESSPETEPQHEEHDHSCPVCLTQTESLVWGPCHHSTCRECMEQILNAQGVNKAWPPHSMADVHLEAPTLGRCPICRQELSLFDVVHKDTSDPLYPRDTDYMLDDRKDSPLRNAVYIPYHGKIGQLSFHWDWQKLRNTQSRRERPFLNLAIPLKQDPHRWMLEDGTYVPRIKYFEPGSHFHVESRTFHGKILWGGSRLNGSYEWDVVLGFPPDYRFLSTGRIHMRREYQVNEENLPAEYTSQQREQCRFPLDGRWTVSWTTISGQKKRIEIQVRNNEYKQSGWAFFLNLQDPRHPTIRWPKSTHSQTVQEGVDLEKHPLGPEIGGKVVWTTTSPNFPTIHWERQTMGPVPTPHVILFGMGSGKQLYQRLDASLDADTVIPHYHVGSLWGNVFCKRLHIGSASYHFLSPSNSFLSYRHPACRDLPPMDDGSPLPTKVPFRNIEWDEQKRKLSCTVEWEEEFGTSWNENVRWKLNMWFDTEFMVILKGGIQCEWCTERRARPHPPRQANPHRPPPVPVYVPPTEEEKEERKEEPDRNEEWVMSGYGHDQLYINAAILERYRKGTAVVDFREIGQRQCRRLEMEGATKRHIGFVKHVFDLGAESPNSSPIDFLV
eukprot:Nitzschia sp. Nitz4//scaffold130_size63480//7477//9324//NITZ4_006239-RA/size63480-processed-gene-0.75-mRNA-1//1//CDS//3329535159//6097//frame0